VEILYANIIKKKGIEA